MYYPSLFQHPFFAPTRVIVVSEERLQAAERQARQEQLEAIEARIDELTKYRTTLFKQLIPSKEPMTFERSAKSGKDLDAMDGGTHDG